MTSGSETRRIPEAGGFALAGETSVLRVVLEDKSGEKHEASRETYSLGSHPSNDLVLSTDTVSRFHCELRMDGTHVRVVDLGSRNGTFVDGVRVETGFLEPGSTLRLGEATLRVGMAGSPLALDLHPQESLGPMVGRSVAIRRVFSALSKCSRSDVTVLLLGESGTGKELAAEAVHLGSPRSEEAFVVVDCGAIPANLLESELFGYVKGAFTGANESRAGVFEEAQGGTIFLDEIGELPLDLQPKLLRVLERGTIKRVGGAKQVELDVRIVAATNRNLRQEVNDGSFRADLYYRLAVVTIELPPLRRRLEDVPLIVETLLSKMSLDPAVRTKLMDPVYLEQLKRYPWPGNVRELRNTLARAAVFEDPMLPEGPSTEPAEPVADWIPSVGLSYADARAQALERFEQRWLRALVDHHDGKVATAARVAGMARGYLHRLLRRHGIRKRSPE